MSAKRFSGASLKLTARLLGEELPLSDFSAVFSINEIPTALAQLPMGRSGKTLAPAAIHRLARQLVVREPVSIYLQVTKLAETGMSVNWEWASKPVRIFDGYVVGIDRIREIKSANFGLRIEHWLADLHYSSAVSGMSHPANPAAFSRSSTYFAPKVIDNSPAGDAAEWVPLTQIVADAKAADNVLEAVWANGFYQWCLAITEVANQDPIDSRLKLGAQGENAAAASRRALARISGAAGDTYAADTGIDTELSDADKLRDILLEQFPRSLRESDVNSTLWGKIVNHWSSSFWLAVSPRVEDAIVFPYAGAVSGDPFLRLRITAHAGGRLQQSLRQSLRAVGIIGTFTMDNAIAGSPAATQFSSAQLGGLYLPDETSSGLVMLRQPPEWLQEAAYNYTYTAQSIAADGSLLGSVFEQIDEDIEDAKAKEIVADRLARQRAANTFLNKYAQALYVNEASAGHFAEIATRLRFDIAPGSQLALESAGEPYVGAGDALADVLYASVARVGYSVSPAAGRAVTSLTLTHLRNEAQQIDPSRTVSRPPMYRQAWKGAPLLTAAARGTSEQEQFT